MILQIRGTSGSGKSTIMKQVMGSIPDNMWVAHYIPRRKQPLYSIYEDMAVLGHYASPCGGCDTIGSAEKVYALAGAILYGGARVVLCEGLLLSEDTKWTLQAGPIKILFLTTPLDRCLKQVQMRRDQAGNDKELNPKNTENRVRTIERARIKLKEAGIQCLLQPPEQAPSTILRWMKSCPSLTSVGS